MRAPKITRLVFEDIAALLFLGAPVAEFIVNEMPELEKIFIADPYFKRMEEIGLLPKRVHPCR